MNGRKPTLLCALSLAAVLFTGCTGQNSQAKPISSDEAKTLALADAGISADAVDHTASTLSSRNKIDYYAVSFTANGVEYQYDIDAMTGTVIESRTAAAAGSQAAGEPSNTQAGPAESESQVKPSGAPSGAALPSDAPSGAVLPSGGSAGAALLTEDEAKEKALANAGYSKDQVTFSKCKLDWENGRQVYEIKFYDGQNEKFSYEVDAKTGTVVSSGYEVKGRDQSESGAAKDNMISADRAKQIALEQVPGAAASDIREFKTDHEDGRLEYEGKIVYSKMKYEFEIDGYSGAIRSWEAKAVND